MNNILKNVIYVLLFAFLGFSREFVFVNINNQLYKQYYKHYEIVMPNLLSFLDNINYTTIYYSKYPLTVLYFLAYYVLTILSVKNNCAIKLFTRWITSIYALLITLAALSMLYNYVINHQLIGDEYTFSRWLMGIAQSPLIAAFLIASYKLYHKFTPN